MGGDDVNQRTSIGDLRRPVWPLNRTIRIHARRDSRLRWASSLKHGYSNRKYSRRCHGKSEADNRGQLDDPEFRRHVLCIWL